MRLHGARQAGSQGTGTGAGVKSYGIVVAGAGAGVAVPDGTTGLVPPKPNAYITSVSPGRAGLVSVTTEPSA